MAYRRGGLIAASMLVFIGLAGVSVGQTNSDRSGIISARHAPGIFRKQLAALGNRLSTKGKEKTVFRGQLFYENGRSSSITVIHQVPQLIRIEGIKAGGGAITFDGRDAGGLAARDDESLLETFLLDMPDGIVTALQKSVELRLVGVNSGPDPRKYPDYDGPRYDVYSLTVQADFGAKLWRHKFYYFDSQTNLLHKTQYKDHSLSPPVKVETYYSMWGTIDGSAFPAHISRFENGKEVFTFIAEEIGSGAGVEASYYR